MAKWWIGDKMYLVDDEVREQLEQQAEEIERLRKTLEECVEPLLRYQSCLTGYAAESAHKGNRLNMKFRQERAKKIKLLQGRVEQALKKQ